MQITDPQLKEQFDIQMELIKTAMEWFDKWNFLEAINLAVRLRVLLHDTNNSTSLLQQIWVKDKLWYYDSSLHRIKNEGFNWAYVGLMQFVVWNDKVFALLDDSPDVQIVDFNQRRNRNIFIDTDGTSLSRKDVVLNIANKIWAHVGLDFDTSYQKIIKDNSLGIMLSKDKNSHSPIKKLEYVAIRQITHELLKTLFENYKFSYTFEWSWFFMCINF
jgi:hypothetical protein